MKYIKCPICKGNSIRFDNSRQSIPCKKCKGLGIIKRNFNFKDNRPVIAFDFDAVIASYKRPFKYNKLGTPVYEIINTINYFKEKGCYILIFTGRQCTPKFVQWLKKYKVSYDGINTNIKTHINASRFKPYYDVLVDDKALNFDWKHNRKSEVKLKKEIENILEQGFEGKE